MAYEFRKQHVNVGQLFFLMKRCFVGGEGHTNAQNYWIWSSKNLTHPERGWFAFGKSGHLMRYQ